ncbi:MAG: hypothetical protein ACF8PN_07135 [Phycisphaerales bacterium]
MPEIRVETESEIVNGWSFEVVIIEPGVAPARRRVSLSWADYDYWCQGRARPEAVVHAVVEVVLEERTLAEIPDRFDAAIARRWIPDADQRLQTRV